jgi:glucose-6-phosphate 1-dehydrogenase
MNTPKKFELPTVFVIFGITGDLFRNKMLKSLYALYRKNLLPKKFQIYGFSRRDYDDSTLRTYVKEIMTKGEYAEPEKYDTFLSFFFYVSGNFDQEESYKKLAEVLGKVDDYWKICSNKLFYLAVPPQHYRNIIDNLHSSGLTIPCSPEEGWTRVILEKPFGTDLKSAKELDARLGELFKEEQIYRVDHYLAKETVRNILAFRFSNTFFTNWSHNNLEKIEVKMFEESTVSKRGDFFDKVGSLRDIGQNHLLQLLALFTMDNPGTLSPDNIRKARATALHQIRKMSVAEVPLFTSRGQYEGYRSEKGVAPDSQTETYFKLKAFSNSEDFKNIPFYIESGKAQKDLTEVVITFKHTESCLCPPSGHRKNVLRYILDPYEKITASFLVKKPGYQFEVEEEQFEFDYRKAFNQTNFILDYEQLLMDIIRGDQTLFVTTEEIVNEWEFVEPILESWNKQNPPLFIYGKGKEFCGIIADDIEAAKKKKDIGIIGLGKMGTGIALHLIEKGWNVHGYNRSAAKVDALLEQGVIPFHAMKELIDSLSKPRTIWIMVTAGDPVEQALFGEEGLVQFLEKGDIVIDGGNSFYKDSIRRGEVLAKKGIAFVDVGFSGGPHGARTGGCLMIGGDAKTFGDLKHLYRDIAVESGFQHFEGGGAGHFVKMIHNGIEYGMMQAIAEGTAVLKKSSFNLNLEKVADIYNNGSVIESRLIAWLQKAFQTYGLDLKDVSGVVGHTGEGAWTVEAAKELGVEVKVIQDSLQFRIDSAKNPSFTGQVLSSLRNMFGGHSVSNK